MMVMSAAICAHADTVNTYNFSTNLWYPYNGSGVSGSFTLDATKGSISSSSLSFSGTSVFSSLGTISLGSQNGNPGTWLFVYTANVYNPGTHQTDTIYFDILMTSAGPSYVLGGVCDASCGGFYDSQFSMQVPEGGKPAAYLFLSLSAVLGAVLVTGYKRRSHPTPLYLA
jgi:hypothetical protein